MTPRGTQSTMVRPRECRRFAIAAIGVALLAVLVPLILTQHGRVVAELGELRRDLHALAAQSSAVSACVTP